MRHTAIVILKFFTRFITQLFLWLPHQKQYIVFSAKYGFTDNSKYLFLTYVEQGANCVWVATDTQCYQTMQSLIGQNPNVRVVKKNSFKLLLILARAKYVFVTHSFLDLGALAIKSCPVINLWHGIPIKKMGYDSISDRALFSLDTHNPYSQNDYLIASSPITKPFLMSCMKLPASKVLPLGQPRNDYLNENKDNNQLITSLRSCYASSSQARLFLFAPTFRDQSKLSLGIYTSLVRSFAEFAHARDILVLRLHPKERTLVANINLPNNVKLSVIEDVQEELLAADILISDYSSIIFDYSLLARPILLYTPDKAGYFKNRGGSYFDYDEILQECRHINTSELDSVWQSNFQSPTYTRLSALHSMSAGKSLYHQFN
ncbi:CDP-glycerol glycerophosphotransferase family protein [Colwellia sp. KU-HH00111]|uniref:CDP-glycerol glycerophosphotransferase family protein n=1 Tax=Colwellia sp. KU-HH00111 TaxID=3127652 RepID=UPI003105A39F